jgi:hypothetical protein
VRVLVTSQAIGALGMTIGFATASLLARDISGSDTQSGLVQTCQVLGAAVASYLLARLMSRRGREADRHAEGAERLADHEHTHGVPLHRGEVLGGRGHRSTGGSSRACHTASQTSLGVTPAASASSGVRPPSSRMTVWDAQ